ncbi:uncharacterized protein LOC118598384 [Oryzias melastigma]|uniref:uncharacterized protein LOC118598384 n=1 Tax=Oryzias melastigma TaxID=30732 RepID=UPI00168D577C|nr:uncharacterized protein LOC118598384 [Oryzias melastigma]
MKEETLRDTLVFGLKSDQVRSDAIKHGNALTFKQVYDLAKVEESTRAQMEIISRGSKQPTDVHAVRSKQKVFATHHEHQKPHMKERDFKKGEKFDKHPFTRKLHAKPNGCYRCGGNHQRSDPCPAKSAQCRYCGKTGHFLKVCMKRNKQLYEISSPDDVHYSDYDTDDTGPTATIGSVTSANAVDTVCRFPDKLFVNVKLNDSHNLNMKIDTGADTCIITTDDLQILPFEPNITSSDAILCGYGGSIIKNVGVTKIKVSYKQKSIVTKFNIVNAPSGSPSMLGCSQAQELGLITVNIDHLTASESKMSTLTKEKVLKFHKECFDKIGKFPGKKYHIELVDEPKPVIHPPRAVPIHIMPLYKAELEKMKADDIITEVTEPTEWVNSITCRITQSKASKNSDCALIQRTSIKISKEHIIQHGRSMSFYHSSMGKNTSVS